MGRMQVSPPLPSSNETGAKRMMAEMPRSSPISIPIPTQIFGIRPPAKGAGAAELPVHKRLPAIKTAGGLGGDGMQKQPEVESQLSWEQAEDATIEDDYLAMAAIELNDTSEEEEEDMGTIAGYCVEELLGTGAFARVFVGRHPDTWDKVAIKQVLKVPAFAAGPVHEFTMVKRCKHKNIVKAIACVEDAGEQFLIFEMADEGDLYDRLEVSGERALTRGACRRYLRQAAEALAHCHTNNIVHGDVKLENMLLHQGAVKLCDFGLAAVVNEVRVGRPYGTSAYMAPELVQIRSKTATYKMTTASDVWGMGIVLYAVLFNDLPWEKATPKDADYTYTLEHGGVGAGPKHFGSLSPGMKALMAGLLHPDPEQRIPMAELVEFLSESRPWFRTDEATSPGGGAGHELQPGSYTSQTSIPRSEPRASGNDSAYEDEAAWGLEDDPLLVGSWQGHRAAAPASLLERSMAVGHRRSSSLNSSMSSTMKKMVAGDPSFSSTTCTLRAQLAAMHAEPLMEDTLARRLSANF